MKIIEIKGDRIAVFQKRVNKFLGIADGEEVHIHDPGRLSRVLYEGGKVLLKRAYGNRKTKWDLIASFYKNRWILTNSAYHTSIAIRLLHNGIPVKAEKIEKEVRYGKSRIDFLINKRNFIEVKGCTFEENNVALFPDAPTQRGRRHMQELMEALKNGYEASIIFLIFVPASCFLPNEKIDKKFADLFYDAISQGVKVYPILLEYDGKWIYYKKKIPVCKDAS